ncbi:hypothetical protein KO317_03610 [Candidatus Micrarchaeota archaeon]|jgi:hypothetical protein|nr:hypothetical protein [Candidatus Micrarchaeota archaeon]
MTTVSISIDSNIYKKVQEYKLDIEDILEEIVNSKGLQLLSLRKAEKEGWDNAEELFKL